MSHGEGVNVRPLLEGIVPTVPLGALIRRGFENFYWACRCNRNDREVNSAWRVQASAMAMGQVAGASAAAACHGDNSLNATRRLSRNHGAIIPVLTNR